MPSAPWKGRTEGTRHFRLKGFDPGLGFGRRRRVAKAFPIARLAKQADGSRQRGNESFPAFAGPQDAEQQIDVPVVGRAERDGVLQCRYDGCRLRYAIEHGVGNRNTVTRRRRPKALAAQEHVQDRSFATSRPGGELRRDRP